MPLVRLPDGTELQLPSPASPRDVAAAIGPGLAKAALAAVIDGVTVGIDSPLPDTEEAVDVRLLTKRDPEALDVMRHSCAHVMARAIMRLHEGVRLAFGPTVDGGYYYDIDLDYSLSEDDFQAIEAEMAKIVKLNEPFERIEQPRDKAIQICRDLQQSYKVEHIEGRLAEHETLSFYQQGEFLDLCRGPHIPAAGAIGAFKILSVAGAYWRGDQNRKQLQRVYGTAFFNKQDLKDHLERIKEAKRRDHRVLGKRLEFFTINPEMVGSGLVLWLPKGAIIRSGLESFVRDELQMRGYQPVYTPHIGRIELFETSGHYPYYKDSMFSPITLEHEEQYLLRPMNCPHHTMIYKTRPRSYRELPLRLAEFGTVYRYEQSGELSGMTRVRGFTQDDAHIFCTGDQVMEEFRDCIDMTQMILNTLGLTNYRVRLGFRDPDSDKYVGEVKNWQKAEDSLVEVCTNLGMEFTVEKGEAAFYGPKADFVVTDCIGREWQLGTVQLDYNLPSDERFALQYIGPDNQPHRPVMIHRAPLGSMERFIGVLIEHFAGAFPLWLAPEQVRILSVSQKFEDYARRIEKQFRAARLRVSGDYRPEKIGAKIRDAQLELIPYMFIIGGREMESDTVAVRDRLKGDLGPMKIDEALAKLQTEIAAKEVRQSFGGNAGLGDRGSENQY
jgi:threonyl-tRNA synthetase